AFSPDSAGAGLVGAALAGGLADAAAGAAGAAGGTLCSRGGGSLGGAGSAAAAAGSCARPSGSAVVVVGAGVLGSLRRLCAVGGGISTGRMIVGCSFGLSCSPGRAALRL